MKENRRLKHLLVNTHHTFLPESMWINGAISNSSAIIKHLFKQPKLNTSNKKKSDYLFKINNNYNLIIVLNEKSNNLILKESLTKRIPIISLNCSDNLLNFNPATYKILGNFSLEHKKTSHKAGFLIYDG